MSFPCCSQGQHVELAAAHGALVVALEHRYYGASNPTPDMSVDNMRFLSSHQAIADVATFITMYLTPMYNLSGSNQIVTFGGSYPGALSAWIRLRLPHLVSVAFSTSSPVLAQLDFTGYNDVVAASMSDPAVGGSQACLATLTTAFVAIDGALRGTPAQQAAMAKQMYSCAAPGSLDDIKLLAGNLAGVVMGVVQYNDDGTQPIDIAGMCNILTQNGVGAVNAFAQVINATLSGAPCMDNSYADFIAQVGNTTVDPTVTGVGMRQWSWEICSQFGLYQTCEVNTQCPFSSLMDLASQLKICTDAFDARMTPALNQAGVDFTNAYLGGKTLDTDRILFTNGLVDPWHVLSVLPSENNNATNAALLIPTGSHCRQMFPSSPNDSPDVIAARVAAASILKGWLTN